MLDMFRNMTTFLIKFRLISGESIFTAGKPALLLNNTLIKSGRPLGNRKHITSSSSTISSVSNNNDSSKDKDKKEKSIKENFHQRFLMDSGSILLIFFY
jgi:hypothetical protein